MLFRASPLWAVVIVLSAAWPALAEDADAVVRYDNYKVVRVHVDGGQQIGQIHSVGGRLMSEAEGLGFVDYLVPPESVAAFAALGLTYKVLNDNVQKDIDAERERLARAPAVDSRDPAWFNDYKDLDAVNAKLNAMVADRPDLAQLLDLGMTLQNRHIYGIRISGPGADKPALLFDGCHHAREWITVMVPMWIADKLVYTYDTDPNVRALVNAVEFFIIPVVNPDGYVYSWTNDRLWRKNRRPPPPGYNCYGVDDNRNYSVGWDNGEWYPCSDTYNGTSAFSEPETAAMRDFALAHPQIVAYQSYHSYGQLFMSPWGYTDALPPDNDLFMAVDEASADVIQAVHNVQYDYGSIYTTIYPADGVSPDWYYGVAGAFAFTTELRDTGTFELPADQIVPTCEENFAAALLLAQWSYGSPVIITLPAELPTWLWPDTPRNTNVKINVIGGTLDPGSTKLFSRIGPYGAFVESQLTPLGDNLYQATLPGTPCCKTLYFYFSAATTTGVVGTLPVGAPNTAYQLPVPPIVSAYEANMDVNPGWTKSPDTPANKWAWGTPTGGGGSSGGPDPTGGYTGTNVMGYNLAGDYAGGLPEMNITTPAINCAALIDTKLSFYRWLGVGAPPDHAYIRVSDNGTAWINVWQNQGMIYDGAWVHQEYDISGWADGRPTVYVRWVMGTTDQFWFHFCGWNVDDVSVWGVDVNGCPYPVGDLNCDSTVDFGDINPFVLFLSNFSVWQQTYAGCPPESGDINGDGLYPDFGDINPFVMLLSGR